MSKVSQSDSYEPVVNSVLSKVWGHVTSRKECHDVTRRVFDMNVDDIRRKDCVNYDMDEKGAKMIRKVYIVSTPLR